jgi:hypothetical protein
MMKRSFALKHNHRYLEMHFQKEKKKRRKIQRMDCRLTYYTEVKRTPMLKDRVLGIYVSTN